MTGSSHTEWMQNVVHVAGADLSLIQGGTGGPLLVLHEELGHPGWLRWHAALAQSHTLHIPLHPGFGVSPRVEWISSVRDLAGFYSRMLHRLCEKSATAGELASGSPWRLVPCVMAHIIGEDRSQLLLLPDAVDDYVGPDNPVRFIDAFVDGLDLEAAGFQRVRSNDKGRPGYDPGDLLKLYIYGYLNRIRSSRRLEVETHRNLEVIWLLRQLRPDFKTIADFRRDNRNAFRAVFRQFVRLCRELDLYGRELIAVDGTRIKAVNKRDRNFTRATLKRDLRRTCDRLDRYLDQMNEADADDAGGRVDAVADLQEKIASIRKRKETLERHRQTLDDTGEAQLSLTDPDSRSMHPGTRVGVGYNVQIAVDTKHNLIAEQQVHSQVSDLGLLAETAAAARENLAVDKIDAVADRGYYKIEDIEDCEAAGITPYVPKPDRSTARHSGHFPKSAFQYDAATDTYRCPAGERLLPLYRASVGKSRAGTYLVTGVLHFAFYPVTPEPRQP